MSMNLQSLLRDKRVLVLCGAGGVGTSAASCPCTPTAQKTSALQSHNRFMRAFQSRLTMRTRRFSAA